MPDRRTLSLFLLLAAGSILLTCSQSPKLKGPLPNILLIVMDAARADHFSCYGYGRKTTPNVDRVAQEGARFSRAVSSSSWTLPSHASLFTGLLTSEHGATSQHGWLIDRFPTLAELLKKKSYNTAAFSNNPFVDREQNMQRGFDRFEAVWSDTTVTSSLKPHNTEYTNTLVRSFLETCPEGPFFVFINYMDTHRPYDPPEPYRSKYLSPGQEITAHIDTACLDARPVNKGTLKINAEEISAVVDVYDGALNYLDAKIGELLDCLRENGLYDSTLVIITSDHGEVFGEHGYFGHGVLLNRPLVHIPLVIRYPALFPSLVVRNDLVGIADIFHSLAALLGFKGTVATGATRRNLFAEKIQSAPCYSELKLGRIPTAGEALRQHDTRSVWTPENLHYILCENETYECYDLTKDFEEQNNLCPSSVTKDEVIAAFTGMEEQLVCLVEEPQDLRIVSQLTVDPQQEKVLRALGYIGDEDSDITQQIQIEHPHVMEHLKTGIFLFKHDSLPAAEQELRTALAMNPNNLKAPIYLGETLYMQKKYQEALWVVQALVGRTNEEVRVRLLLGKILVDSGKDDQALQQFFKIAEIDPSEPNARINAANLLMKKGDSKTAESHLQKLLTYYPDNLFILENVIKLHLQYRNWKAARRLLLEEIKKNPIPRVYFNLSQVCLNLGKKEEARSYLQLLLNKNLPPQIRERVEEQLKEL